MSEFDQFAHTYRQELDRVLRPFGAQGHEFITRKVELLTRLAARLGPPRYLRVLDVGCGAGDLTHALAPHFAQVHGIEPSTEMLKVARDTSSAAKFSHVPEGAPLPFKDGEFELAFMSCVLHHVGPDERDGLLNELQRVVRPGGLIIAIEHNPWNPVTQRIVSQCSYDEEIDGLLSPLALRRAYKRAGLRAEQTLFTVFFPGPLRPLRQLETYLAWLPLGGQYVSVGRVPATSDRPVDWEVASARDTTAELSLVLPFFNEEENVDWVIRAMVKELRSAKLDFELVCVDNGSLDATASLLVELSREIPELTVVDVFPNRGFGWGVQRGLEQGSGRWVAWMAGDGQNPPSDVVATFRALQEQQAQMAKVRRVSRGDGALRKTISIIYNLIFSLLCGRHYRDANGTPKIFERRSLRELKLKSKDWFIDAEILLKAESRAWKVVEVPVDFLARKGGSSNVRPSTLVEFILNLLKTAPAYWVSRMLRRPL